MADLTRKTANLFNPEGNWNDFDCSHSISGNDVTVSGLRFSYIAFTAEANTEYAMSHKTVANQRIAIYAGSLSGSALAISTSGFLAFTTSSETQLYILFYASDGTTSNTVTYSEIMLVKGNYTAQTMPPFEPYGWVHSLRKLCSATETIQSGDTIYADGQPITTFMLKGNEEHTGTPSPSNPVMPQGTGDKTANLFPVSSFTGKSYTVMNNFNSASETIEFLPNTQYTISLDFSATLQTGIFKITFVYTDETSSSSDWLYGTTHRTLTSNVGKTVSSISLTDYAQYVDVVISDIMFNVGSTALPYEPYGYKIPISSGQASAVNYLGSVQTTRQIKKIVFDGTEDWQKSGSASNGFYMFPPNLRTLSNAYCNIAIQTKNTQEYYTTPWTMLISNTVAINTDSAVIGGTTKEDWKAYLAQQYANGTPVTVWYVLATEETGIVNEPLMKIDDYADTLSNATPIPTTEGANTITVDTTVQPSEFTATWTGWHDAEVKEKSENLFDGTLIGGYFTAATFTTSGDEDVFKSIKVYLSAGTYTFSWGRNVNVVRLIIDGNYSVAGGTNISSYTITSATDGYVGISFRDTTSGTTVWDNTTPIMLNTGQTALPYAPYWK